MTRLLDLADLGLTTDLRRAYQALAVRASACTECGDCTKRCPSGADVVANMRRAAALHETIGREEVTLWNN